MEIIKENTWKKRLNKGNKFMQKKNSSSHKLYLIKKNIQHFIMRNIIPLNKIESKAIVDGSKIFANSLPKSGTHLLRRILSMMPGIIDKWTYHFDPNVCNYQKQLSYGKKGQIISAHLYYDVKLSDFLEENNYKKFLMVRDLRDVCVSTAHYCKKDKRHRLYNYYNSLNSWDDCLAAAIKGIGSERLSDGIRSKSISEHVEKYLPWISDKDCLLVKFEDLVGVKGGGDLNNQLNTIRDISIHIGLNLQNDNIKAVASKAFGGKSKTFRKGQIGGWRNEFSDGNIELFKKIAGQQLIDLGYEKNGNW